MRTINVIDFEDAVPEAWQEEVMNALEDSKVSFGMNDETLVSWDTLESAMEDYEIDEEIISEIMSKRDDTCLIALGC